MVNAPIQVAGRLQGLVVLPRPPGYIEVFNELARVLSLSGTLILIGGTVVATWVIFRPASRRLRSLEQAALRVQQGDLSARVDVEGNDEIARVARAFNLMGDDLAARDEALRAADRTRRQMLADVSHELKTPLTTIRGYIETLQMGSVDNDRDKRVRYLDTVAAETHRLEKIVADLLDLAHHENRVGALDARVFAIDRVFQEVARRREQELHARHIDLRIHVDEWADQVVADPDRIDQAIDNLVVNALRHVPDGGTMELRAMRGPRFVSLLVIDSGTGIPPEHLDRVFDRFYKVDAARVAGGAGSGLGLSIVKAIVDRHGGSVGVTSRPGRTEFKIVLPQADHLGRVINVGELVADAPCGQEQTRILRIDFDLFPHAADDGIHGALGHVFVIAPDMLEKRRAAEHHARPSDQSMQKVELLTSELDWLAANDRDTPAAVQSDFAPCRGRERRHCFVPRLMTLVPARERLHAGEQLAHAKRLGQIVIGAALEPRHLVGLASARGQHQDGGVGIRSLRADTLAEREPIQPRQHHIENEQIEARGAGQTQGGRSVASLLHLIAGEAEMQAQQLSKRRLVFDDQGLSHKR